MKNTRCLYVYGGHPVNGVLQIKSLPEAFYPENEDLPMDEYPWNSVYDRIEEDHGLYIGDLEWFPFESIEDVRNALKLQIWDLEKELGRVEVLLHTVEEGME